MFGGLVVESRERRALVEAVHRSQAVASFAIDGTILSANDNFLALFGYGADEVIGRTHAMFVDPGAGAKAVDIELWRQLRAGRFQQAEFKRLGKDGRFLYIKASYNPILGAGGKPVKIATDITAATRLAMDDEGQIKALRQSQCVIEFELDGTILSANEKFLDAFGYRLEEVRGRHHRMFVDAATVESQAYRTFWNRLRSGIYQAGEFQRIGKEGREVFIQATYNPITDRDGRPIKIVKFAADITNQVREHRRREDLQKVVAEDLNGIAEAASDVARQASDASSTAVAVRSDVEAVVVGADHLFQSADRIGVQISQATTILGRAVDETIVTTSLMGELGQHAARIEQAIALIRGIASQTDLLALNATIEAARSGDAGRGVRRRRTGGQGAGESDQAGDRTGHGADRERAAGGGSGGRRHRFHHRNDRRAQRPLDRDHLDDRRAVGRDAQHVGWDEDGLAKRDGDHGQHVAHRRRHRLRRRRDAKSPYRVAQPGLTALEEATR